MGREQIAYYDPLSVSLTTRSCPLLVSKKRMLTAHNNALNPNNEQATYFARVPGTARFAYNWALAEWQNQYEPYKADSAQLEPSQTALRHTLNVIKREQFPWMLKITKNAPQIAVIQLGEGFKNFFASREIPAIPQDRCQSSVHEYPQCEPEEC